MKCDWGKKQFDSSKKTITKLTPVLKNHNKIYTAKELIYWCSKTNGDELLFDKFLDIHGDITRFLNDHGLKIQTDKELFLMKLLLFVYDNSN